MNTHDAKERAQDLLRETDNCIRANPIPAVLTALGVGIVIGLLSHLIEPPARKHEPLHDALDELRSLLASGARKGKSAYDHSAEAVREAVEQAVEKAREIDIDPVAKWWKRIWS